MKVVLIYNPKSGSSLSATELRKLCKERSIVIATLIPIAKLRRSRLLPYINKGVTIAAVGGDGTLSAVAGIVAGTRAIFAPLPGGTLNHFTKDLGIAQDLGEALENMTRGSIHPVDIATVNGVVFINNASLGIYPSSLRARSSYEDKLGKWPAAVFASVRSLIRFRTYTVTVGGETFKTPFVFVGNNKYDLDEIGGAVRKRLNGGKLSIFIAQTTSRMTLLKIALFTLVGRSGQLDEFDIRSSDSLIIHTRRPKLSISHDGEVSHMKSPLTFEIQKKTLRVRY
jgi:diacylglycerol kinase family enzyme